MQTPDMTNPDVYAAFIKAQPHGRLLISDRPNASFDIGHNVLETLARMAGEEHSEDPASVSPALKDMLGKLNLLAKLTVRFASRVTGFLVWASKDPDSELGREVAKMFRENMETLGEQDDSRSQRMLARVLGGVRERIAVEAALAEKSSVEMIWGAAHFPSFLRRFEEHGYKLASSKVLL